LVKQSSYQQVVTKNLEIICTSFSDFCTRFDPNVAKGEGDMFHHPNYADLIASAKYGCEICIEIRRQMENKEPTGIDDPLASRICIVLKENSPVTIFRELMILKG
jgi:hypothetical protein